MTEIKRFRMGYFDDEHAKLYNHPDGEFVTFEDHEAALRSAARTDAGYGAGFEAGQLWSALKDRCAVSPDKSKVKKLVLVSEEDVKAAIAALPAPGGITTGWQEIETAPKGNGLIDVWTAGWGAEPHRVADCYYDSICDEWRTSRPTGQLICVKARYVTHWQPLPPPPTITRKSQSEAGS